ncbi:hypothetical protein M3484_00710 [Pseudomonas sp. GX19020]|uniref:hypothetical protein n=1 Tax=Pseudomonas sp. GX19020 TaxID=2942277 RepID=UPI0020191327|nr:hypothetical protein [Pseudomonas sp. GX19020]MCL4065097.1 hypothetical protein [Pseudomonas sp. GX19020]
MAAIHDFFAEMDRFMQPENLWHLAQYHETLPHNGSMMSLKRASYGVEMHIFRPGEGVVRYQVGQRVSFDGVLLSRLLTTDRVAI